MELWKKGRTIEPVNEMVLLTPENIDGLSEKISHFLQAVKMERANRIRIRFSLEEAVLRWMDHFGQDAVLHVEMNVSWGRPTITFTMPGEQFNPLVSSENDLGDWAENLYSGLSLSPVYNYRKGFNVLQLKLPSLNRNPALELMLSVLIGAAVGVLGKALLPETVRSVVLSTVLDPIEGVFLRILNASSGPVIFLSVMTAICGIGMLPSIGKSGKDMVGRFLALTLFSTAVAALFSYFLLGLNLVRVNFAGKEFTSILDFFLGMIPNDIMSPFIEGNSPQLIALAIIIGNALITNSAQTGGLRSIIEQADSIGLTVAGWVSNLTPFFVATLLILGIWNGSVSIITGLWKPFAVYFLVSGIALYLRLRSISRDHDVPIKLLVKKMKDSFHAAFVNASVDAAIGDSQILCEKRFGISKKLTDYAFPLGMVIYMPSGCIACTIVTLYAAHSYNVEMTPVWLAIAVVLTAALIAATPPVAGIGLLTYTAIFAQLGIPRPALTMAMVADITLGFAVSALNLAMLQLELVYEASKVDLLDERLLRKDH